VLADGLQCQGLPCRYLLQILPDPQPTASKLWRQLLAQIMIW